MLGDKDAKDGRKGSANAAVSLANDKCLTLNPNHADTPLLSTLLSTNIHQGGDDCGSSPNKVIDDDRAVPIAEHIPVVVADYAVEVTTNPEKNGHRANRTAEIIQNQSLPTFGEDDGNLAITPKRIISYEGAPCEKHCLMHRSKLIAIRHLIRFRMIFRYTQQQIVQGFGREKE